MEELIKEILTETFGKECAFVYQVVKELPTSVFKQRVLESVVDGTRASETISYLSSNCLAVIDEESGKVFFEKERSADFILFCVNPETLLLEVIRPDKGWEVTSDLITRKGFPQEYYDVAKYFERALIHDVKACALEIAKEVAKLEIALTDVKEGNSALLAVIPLIEFHLKEGKSFKEALEAVMDVLISGLKLSRNFEEVLNGKRGAITYEIEETTENACEFVVYFGYASAARFVYTKSPYDSKELPVSVRLSYAKLE